MKTLALAILAASLIEGCTSGPAKDPGARGTAPSRGSDVDASYDWHGQVILPFGALLKSSPVPLHEVLLFHDAAASVATPGVATPGEGTPDAAAHSADGDSKDCYAIDGKPPRLLGQTPDSYLLCFDHDRLNRIESTVHLAADAAQVLARACASWQTGAAPAVPTPGVCEGRSGSTTFNAHLIDEPGASATLSLTLSNANPVP